MPGSPIGFGPAGAGIFHPRRPPDNTPPAVSATNAIADIALGTGGAFDATASLAPNGGSAATGAALGATASVNASAGISTGTGAAASPTSGSAATAGTASGSAAASAPSGSVNAAGGAAAGTAVASNATTTSAAVVSATAGIANGNGSAGNGTAPSPLAPTGGGRPAPRRWPHYQQLTDGLASDAGGRGSAFGATVQTNDDDYLLGLTDDQLLELA